MNCMVTSLLQHLASLCVGGKEGYTLILNGIAIIQTW